MALITGWLAYQRVTPPTALSKRMLPIGIKQNYARQVLTSNNSFNSTAVSGSPWVGYTGDLTVAGWVKLTAVGGTFIAYGAVDGALSTRGFALLPGSGAIAGRFGVLFPGSVLIDTSTTLSTNAWTHAA